MSTTPLSNRTLTIEFVFDTKEHCIDAFDYFNRNQEYYLKGIVPWSIGLVDLKTEIKVNQFTWDRQQVLREEWKCGLYEPCVVVDADNRIWDFSGVIPNRHNIPVISWGAYLSFQHPIVLSSTRELAEEIVAIREGRWAPQKGDIYYQITKDLHSDSFRFTALPNYIYDASRFYYFPSKRQRDAFIKKNKPKGIDNDIDKAAFVDHYGATADHMANLYKNIAQMPVVPSGNHAEPLPQPSPYSDKPNQILSSYKSLDELILAINTRSYQMVREEIYEIQRREKSL